MEIELQAARQKESSFLDEIGSLKRKLKEEQLLMKREQSTREQYSQENGKLIKENSELTSRLNRAERLAEQQERDRPSRAEKAKLAEVTSKINKTFIPVVSVARKRTASIQ
jgi:chromosome segregation ATPase